MCSRAGVLHGRCSIQGRPRKPPVKIPHASEHLYFTTITPLVQIDSEINTKCHITKRTLTGWGSPWFPMLVPRRYTPQMKYCWTLALT